MSNITDLSKLFRGLVDDMDAEDVNRLQVPQMTQQQIPQVQIPMAPPATQQYTPESFDNIGVVPPVQMNIPQPTMPTAAPLPESSDFYLRTPKPTMSIDQMPQLGGNIPQVTDPNFLDSMPQGPAKGSQEELDRYRSVDPFNLGQSEQRVSSIPGMIFGDSLDSAQNLGKVTRDAVSMPGRIVKSMLPGGKAAQFVERTVVDPYIEPVVDAVSTGVEYVADPLVRFGQGFVGTEATGVPTGSIPRLSADSDQGILKPEGSEIPKADQESLDGEPVVGPSLLRPDGTTKSMIGFLGPIKGNDNSLRTELSIGVNFGNGEVLIPSMVPGLTPEDIEVLRNLPEGELPPQSIIDKAKAHAEERIANNLSPFYQDGEEVLVEQDDDNDGVEQDDDNDGVDKEITVKEANIIVNTIDNDLKTGADEVIESLGEKEDDEPEESFLKRVWNGVSGFFKEQLDDPKVRRTLFAYIASRAVGYDGVTFAGQVLENEWKQEAAQKKLDNAEKVAQKKQDFELEKIYGKEGLATLKAEKKAKAIDPSKVATIYDKETETNLTGAFSADGTRVRLDNAGFYESLGIEPDASGVYPVLSVANVRAAQGGKRFSVGVGLTGNDIISGIRANIDLDVDNAINNYVSEQKLETDEAKALTTRLNSAINGTVRNGAARAFKSFYPAGTDFSDFNLQEVSTNAVKKYIQSVARGMEGNSTNLAAFMEKERLKVETKYSVSPSFFKVVGDGSEDAIGGEAWSKVTAKVKYLASAFGKEIGANKAVPKVAMWSNLERLYNKQAEEMGPEFKTFWESESKGSADKKGQGASPALLWVMSMDRNKSTTNSKYFAGSIQDVINKMK